MAVALTASEAYNLLQEFSCIVFDTRPQKLFSKGHIRCSSRVGLSPSGRTLEQKDGPGPPVWHSGCWYDRHVLIVVWAAEGDSRKRKGDSRASTAEENEVVRFLLREGLAKSVRVLSAKGAESAFSEFAMCFPFAITKSNRSTPVGRYPSEVMPGFLYLGDWDHATEEEALQDLSITHIVTAHSSPLALKRTFKQLHLQLEDEPKEEIARYFSECSEFLDEARSEGGRALVHCGAGASRSATLCAAFLMHTQHWNFAQALKHLKQCRSKVAPNEGFVKALQGYEKLLDMSVRHHDSSRAFSKRATPANDANDTKHPLHSGLQLLVMKDGAQVEAITVEHGKEHVLGRSTSCDTVLNHASISKTHASITWRRDNFAVIADLASVHGTMVDGRAVKDDAVLSEGSVVTFAASTRSYIVHYPHKA